MKRHLFANPKKKLTKGFWVTDRFDYHEYFTLTNPYVGRKQENIVVIDSVGSEVSVGTNVIVWAKVCDSCGHRTRKFERTGKCDCKTAKCPHCKGSRCSRCNFTGRL